MHERESFGSGLGNSCAIAGVPARLDPESPGLRGLVEAARDGEFETAHVIARERLRFGEIWLEPGERFRCGKRLAA
jgi:hypothetical protein